MSGWNAEPTMMAAMAADDERALGEEIEYEAAIAACLERASQVVGVAAEGRPAVPIGNARRSGTIDSGWARPSGGA
jgi:hypothetical protein